MDSKNSDQTGRMPRLIRVFTGYTGLLFCHVPTHMVLLMFSLSEKMATEVALSSSWKKRSNKRKSHHGTLHIPRGKDVTDELMRSYDDNPDMMDDRDIKEMTMTLASKRKLRYSDFFFPLK